MGSWWKPLLKFLDPPLYGVALCAAGIRKFLCVNEIEAVYENLKLNLQV